MSSTTPSSPNWSSLYPPSTSDPIVIPYATMLEAWKATVSRRADELAVQYFERRLTFRDVEIASDRLAAALLAHGVVTGDRVACFLQNDPQWLVTLLASWKLGGSAVCVNPMYRARELEHLLKDAQPTALVCQDSLYAEIIAANRARLNLPLVVTTSPWDMLGNTQPPSVFAASWGDRRTFDDTLDWLDIQETEPPSRTIEAPLSGNDPAILTYTSGTTGPSKGAINHHAALLHSSTVYADWCALSADTDTVLAIAPLCHVTGSVAGLGVTILTGAPLVLLHRFDAAVTLQAIDRYRPTFTVAASTAYSALSSHPDHASYDLSSLTKTFCGGAPLTRTVIDRVREATGWQLQGVYGLTETTSATTICPPGITAALDHESGVISVGIPVPGARVRIVDPVSGREARFGHEGEILISGPMLFDGYWRAPEESSSAVRDGWLHTGDVGKLDASGWLFLIDRLKDQVNAGGYKVWPREVEEVLCMHSAVQEAAVVGIPDDYRGETVKAFVVLRHGVTATPEKIIDFCKERLAAYKYPRVVEIVSELPKNASGKVLRRELRTKAGHGSSPGYARLTADGTDGTDCQEDVQDDGHH